MDSFAKTRGIFDDQPISCFALAQLDGVSGIMFGPVLLVRLCLPIHLIVSMEVRSLIVAKRGSDL